MKQMCGKKSKCHCSHDYNSKKTPHNLPISVRHIKLTFAPRIIIIGKRWVVHHRLDSWLCLVRLPAQLR